MVRRVLPDQGWKDMISMAAIFGLFSNDMGESFCLNTDSCSENWGLCDTALLLPEGGPFGRILVIRQDEKELTLHQVEVLSAYFHTVCEELKNATDGRLKGLSGTKLQQERTEVLGELIKRAKFEIFFAQFKDEKLKAGDVSWADAVSPTSANANGNVNALSQGMGALGLN